MKDRKWWNTLWRSEPAPQRHSAPPQVIGRDAADDIPHISFSFLNESGTTVVKSPNISSINLQSVNTRNPEGTYSSPRGSTSLQEDDSPDNPSTDISPSTLDSATSVLNSSASKIALDGPPSTPATLDHPMLSIASPELENIPATFFLPINSSKIPLDNSSTPTSSDHAIQPCLSTLDDISCTPNSTTLTNLHPLESPPLTPTSPVLLNSSPVTPISENGDSPPHINHTVLYQSSGTPSHPLGSSPVVPTSPKDSTTLTSTSTLPGNDRKITSEISTEFPKSDMIISSNGSPIIPGIPKDPSISSGNASMPVDSPITTTGAAILEPPSVNPENDCPTPTPESPIEAEVPEDTATNITAENSPPRMSVLIADNIAPSVDSPEKAVINIASSTSTLVADSRPVSPRALTISLPLELGSCADWETITELSEYKHDSDYEDVITKDEYCEHRAHDPRRRRVRGAVRTRIRKAWRAVRGWWSEERLRITDVIHKHAQAQAVKDETDNNVVRRRCALKQENRRPCSRAGTRRSRYIPEGQNGFEELRRYIKQGGDFCKDLSAILQERSEAETQYAKSLSKLSGKLLKASRDSVGTVTQAWQRAGAQMEAQSEVHRAFATALSEEVVKPLRQLIESQHRIRKSVESAVDKTGKSLSEWRSAESKTKKQSFMSARENEKLQDAMLDVRLGRASSTTHLHLTAQHSGKDKDTSKLESKRRKAEEAVKKADVEYYTFSLRAERARLEWETAVIRGSHCFQALEEERLQQLKDLATCYLNHLQEIGPKMVQGVERLREPVENCDVARDIQTVVSIKGTGQPIPEQLLPDFYAEHITLAMNRDRRRQALVKLLQLIRQDLDREKRGKQGVENLARALQQTPTFGAEDSQQNVTEKLHHMRSMLTYLEAMRYKVQSALAELDGRTRGGHPLAAHIQVTRDRQGLQQSVLKVPPWVREESLDRLAGDSPDWTDRGTADGNSVQPDSDFERVCTDEFSSQGSEKDYQSSVLTQCPVISQPPAPPVDVAPSIGRCKALYEYTANLYDELNLQPGDIIKIHDKQADGWWLGELNGVVGIFPATYVQEVD